MFDNTVFLGLTRKQVTVLCIIPTFGSFPAHFLDFLPFWSAFVIGAVIFGITVTITLRTPPGQNPLSWFPAAVSRRVGSNVYRLKTREVRDRPVYKDNIHRSYDPPEDNDSVEPSPPDSTKIKTESQRVETPSTSTTQPMHTDESHGGVSQQRQDRGVNELSQSSRENIRPVDGYPTD